MIPVDKNNSPLNSHLQTITTKKRKRFSYSQNHTISRKIDFLEQKEGLQYHLMDLPKIQDATKDHASRRVQIFYYQSVAYYKEGCSVTKDKTILQHGSSNYEWSSAAHSAILPNVTDNFFKRTINQLKTNGIDIITAKKLKALGVNSTKIESCQNNKPLNLDTIQNLFKDIDTKHGLINAQGSFFHTMNSTVELPDIVNQYDTLIEGKMRPLAISLLNKVSKEIISPYEATKVFVNLIHQFFEQSLKMTQKKIFIIKNIYELEQKIWFLEKKIITTSRSILESDDLIDIYLKTIDSLKYSYFEFNKLRDYCFHRKFKNRLPWQKSLFIITVQNPTVAKDNIIKQISNNFKWNPKTITPYLLHLRTSLKILYLQLIGTQLPKIEMLSGIVKNGQLAAMNDDELFEQKLDIVKRFS